MPRGPGTSPLLAGLDAGVIKGKIGLVTKDERFLRILKDAIVRPPPTVPKISTIRKIVYSSHRTTKTVGLTRYSDVKFLVIFSRPSQTITFYSELMDALSDGAAEAVIAHELAHAWLNEHVEPEESAQREKEADSLARSWGFGSELDALDKEAYTV